MEEHVDKFIYYADLTCKTIMTKENNKIGFFKKKKYKVFKTHLEKYKKELENISSAPDIYGLEVVKHMYDYLRLCEESNIIDEFENNINVVSLKSGLEANPENDYYFLIRNETKLLNILVQESIDQDKFIACLDHMYFHSYKFFVSLGNDSPYPNYVFTHAKKYSSAIKKTSKIIRKLVEAKIMENENLEHDTNEYKDEVKETAKNLVEDITGSVEDVGYKNIGLDDLPNLLQGGNIDKLKKSIGNKYKSKSGIYKEGKVIDGVTSLLKIVADSGIKDQNKDAAKLMRTVCEVVKSNKQVQNNPNVQRLLLSLKKDFGGKQIDGDSSIDPKLYKKLTTMQSGSGKTRYKVMHRKK